MQMITLIVARLRCRCRSPSPASWVKRLPPAIQPVQHYGQWRLKRTYGILYRSLFHSRYWRFFQPRRAGRKHRFHNEAHWCALWGKLSGKREDGDQIVVLIQTFDFISVRGTKMTTQASTDDEVQSSPITPRKDRWMNWRSRSTTIGSPQTTPGKKRAHDAADLEDTQDIASPSKFRRLASSVSTAGTNLAAGSDTIVLDQPPSDDNA
jgi:hypothetical protein